MDDYNTGKKWLPMEGDNASMSMSFPMSPLAEEDVELLGEELAEGREGELC